MNNIISPLFKFWSFIMALIVAFSCVGYSPMPSIAYPAMLLLSFFIVILESFRKSVHFSNILLFLLAASLISIIIGQPDIRFRSYQRLAYFTLLMVAISPMLNSKKLSYHRYLILKYLLFMIVLLSVGSFFCYFLGINLMQIDDDSLYLEDFSIGGTFGGLIKHSMLLGPFSVIAILYLLTTQNKIFSRVWVNRLLMLFCFGALLLSAARGAIYGGLVAILYTIYLKSNNKIKFIKIMILLLVIIVITLPLWEFMLHGIVYKNNYRSDSQSGFLASRMYLYRHRINEFLSNPITGIGFSSAMSFNYIEVHQSGTVEYGNSWLCLLSTIGLLGAIPAVVFFLSRFFGTYKLSKNNPQALFFSASLLFFFIHFMIEGYILSAGSPLCFLFWLLLSNSSSKNVSSLTV